METQETDGKQIGMIAYLTVIGLIIAFVMNNEKKSEFAQYHIRQMLGLFVSGVAIGLIGIIPILGWLIVIVGVFILFYMWVMGLIAAINGQMKPMPILGKKYEEWFAGA
ncbi:DUF4870 domain-containing protein [Algoriphagus sp.]|uniref:DUF4870 domain-containing protein n=1 Tax=Algoriphagus sp. TaxID=1872435 RepID=UPI00391C927E